MRRAGSRKFWASARTRTLVAAAAVALAACAAPHGRAPASAPAPPGPAAWAGVTLEPLGLSPDGAARLLVQLHYRDARGTTVHVLHGGHVTVVASAGEVQWQPRARFGDPAAIVSVTAAGPLDLRVASDLPRVPRLLRARTDTRGWGLPSAVARPLGPHTVVLGWFPRVERGAVQIARRTADGPAVVLTRLPAPASTFRDTSVVPGGRYTYELVRPGRDRLELAADVPLDLPPSRPATVGGKGVWLSFSPRADEPDAIARWDVAAMLDRMAAAGIRYVQLRLSYGEFVQITPAARAPLDRFIDGAAARGIAVVGWIVPRAAAFEDESAAAGIAAYRTPAGHAVSGLALDLERGAEFLGEGRRGFAALSAYAADLRAALGPRVLLIGTVEDPVLERLDARAVPYAAIAASVDVLQPMVYWRARGDASPAAVEATVAASMARVRALATVAVPINLGAQSVDLGNRTGAPGAAEIAAAVTAARRGGAVGVTFYDWSGTTPDRLAAIATAAW